jgi:hypothetical protein
MEIWVSEKILYAGEGLSTPRAGQRGGLSSDRGRNERIEAIGAQSFLRTVSLSGSSILSPQDALTRYFLFLFFGQSLPLFVLNAFQSVSIIFEL